MAEVTAIQGFFETLKTRAENDESYNTRCFHCKEKVVFLEHTEALGKGHIYSSLGKREYHITQSCEYCFDEITKEPDDDDEGPWIVDIT